MSKHGHAKKQQAQVNPLPVSGDSTARPQASRHAGEHHPLVTNGPDPASNPGGWVASTHEQIAVRAYELWVARGEPVGDGREDWFEAERQLRGGGPNIATGIAHEAQIETPESVSPRHLDPGHQPKPGRGGEPRRSHEADAEQTREARESEEARRAGPSSRERMVDIGRGNQQAGRQGQ